MMMNGFGDRKAKRLREDLIAAVLMFCLSIGLLLLALFNSFHPFWTVLIGLGVMACLALSAHSVRALWRHKVAKR